MKLRGIHWPISVLLLACPFFVQSSAQTATSGGLAGVVTDPSHAVIPDAVVEIKHPAKGTTQSARTDRVGTYHFFFLAPGRYELTVAHAGFHPHIQTVDVPLGPDVSVNVVLDVGPARATVNVNDDASILRAENGDVSITVNQEQISQVPNPGNDLPYIVQTAPGAVMNTDQQGGPYFSLLGMPGTSYLYTVDGMNDNDNSLNLNNGGPLILLLGQNQVQEATVLSTGYSGQFGGAAGGIVNYITKSGSNAVHGNAQYYWNGRALNANNWFNKAFGSPRPFNIANQWAASLGGPIKRDKVFFFLDTEGLRVLLPQNFLVTLPSADFEKATIDHIDANFGVTSASHLFYRKIFDLYKATPGAGSATLGSINATDPLGCNGFSDKDTGLGITSYCARYFFTSLGRPSQDSLVSSRIDWNVRESDRIFARLQYDWGHAAVQDDPINPAFDGVFDQPWWQNQVVETHSFGSSAANQFLFAATYYAPIFHVNDSAQALSLFPTQLYFAQGEFMQLGGTDYFKVFGTGRYNTQYQVSDDLVKLWNKHKVEFGASFERINWSELPERSHTIGLVRVSGLRAFYEGGIDPSSPDVNFTRLDQSFTSKTNLPISFQYHAFYGHDEWRVRSNLTLTIALRAEHLPNAECEKGCFASLAGPFAHVSHDPDQPYNQAIRINQRKAFTAIDRLLWSPRFGFAWQPLGVSDNIVVRGGFGIFYDPIAGFIPDSFRFNPPNYNQYTIFSGSLAPDETGSVFSQADISNGVFVNGFDTGQTLAEMKKNDPNFFPPAIVTQGNRTHFPQYQRWSLELEKAFGASTSINIGYYGNHGIHETVMDPDSNAFGFGSLPSGLCGSSSVPPCADARFSGVTTIGTAAVSNYHGMVISFEHRLNRGSNGLFHANYTFGHAFDEGSNGGLFPFTFGGSLVPQDPNNLKGAYGPSEYDVRHSFNASYVWEVPVKAVLGGRGWDPLVKGWQVSGTVFARTGFPYTVFDWAQSANLVDHNYFGGLYAVPTSPVSEGPSCGEAAAITLARQPCQPPQTDGTTPSPGARFLQATCETGFNSGRLPAASGPCDGPLVNLAQGRNQFRAPGYFTTDFAIAKSTPLHGENVTLTIGLQFFNAFNHPNFGFPMTNIADPSFGLIVYLEQPPTSVLGSARGEDASPRMIQLKAQLRF